MLIGAFGIRRGLVFCLAVLKVHIKGAFTGLILKSAVYFEPVFLLILDHLPY